jgi:(2R)-ethylmalonyl-CoA mutase
MSEHRERDRPWVFRTYSGHSSAQASNELYRTNLAKGQTGLSVAFDLPTQTGFDADHPLARGEVGKVGVPIAHVEDMQTLFEGIPLDRMNTSMTINATAAWLLALYVAAAQRNGVDPKQLQGTTQNDIVKEYLSRGTYVFPPEPSMRLIGDMVAYSVKEIPRWNPINVCSYHLQEAGATPVQEIAYAMANALAVLVGRISFFLNAGIRFVDEICKVRAMAELWDELTRERYGVQDEKLRRFRYGVQVNSLGLTEAQPENNVIRIVLESLGVTASKKARCRALQLPAWNEALGLPRPWDQQWSLRIQQILAYETDLLEHEDLFDGSRVVEARTEELIREARTELEKVLAMGGAVAAVENAYMKQRLVESQTSRAHAIEDGSQIVVGVNRFRETEPSPLVGDSQSILVVDESAEREQIERLRAFRGRRNDAEVTAALRNLADVLADGGNVMPASIRAAEAGGPTAQDAGGQAGPGWSQQWRGADRRACARRGHGGRVRGHSPHARGDRPVCPRRRRARHRSLDPVGLPRRAGARRAGAPARERPRRAAGGGGWHHPRRGRRGVARCGRTPRLHSQGLRPHGHHGRRGGRRGGVGRCPLRRPRSPTACSRASATRCPRHSTWRTIAAPHVVRPRSRCWTSWPAKLPSLERLASG